MVVLEDTTEVSFEFHRPYSTPCATPSYKNGTAPVPQGPSGCWAAEKYHTAQHTTLETVNARGTPWSKAPNLQRKNQS